MTISPVALVTAAPIAAMEKVERVRRRPKWAKKGASERAGLEAAREPMHAATSPEEMASDETRTALLNIRLGG